MYSLQEAYRRKALAFLKIGSELEVSYSNGSHEAFRASSDFANEWPHLRASFDWALESVGSDRVAAELCALYPQRMARLLFMHEPPQERRRWHQAAARAASILKRQELWVTHIGNLGLAFADLSEYSEAIECHKRVLEWAEDNERDDLTAKALSNIGIALKVSGRAREAISYHRRSLALKRAFSDKSQIANTLNNLSAAMLELKKWKSALILASRALAIRREIGDPRGEGTALGNIGEAYMGMGEIRKATLLFIRYRKIARRIGDVRGQGIALGNLGEVSLRVGNPKRAVLFWAARLSPRYSNSLDRQDRAETLLGVAKALMEMGRDEEAKLQACAGLQVLDNMKYPKADSVRKELSRLMALLSL